MLKRVKNISFIFVIALVAQLIFAQRASAASFKYLPIAGIKQINDKSCWAAVTQSLVKYYYYKNLKQEDLTDKYKKVDGNYLCNTVLRDQKIIATQTMPMSFKELKNQINAGHPIIAFVDVGKNRPQGHVVIIYGYYDSWNAQNISYMDPWYKNWTGGLFSVRYSDIKIGNLKWIAAAYTKIK